jgi:hypothetical protein
MADFGQQNAGMLLITGKLPKQLAGVWISSEGNFNLIR